MDVNPFDTETPGQALARAVTREHEKRIAAAIVERLGLHPNLIKSGSLRAGGSGDDGPVLIEWDGIALMPRDEFRALVESVDTKDD